MITEARQKNKKHKKKHLQQELKLWEVLKYTSAAGPSFQQADKRLCPLTYTGLSYAVRPVAPGTDTPVTSLSVLTGLIVVTPTKSCRTFINVCKTNERGR